MTSLLAGTPKKLLAGALVLLAISYAVAPSRHKPRIVPSARLSAAARRALAKFAQSKAISEGFAEALMLRWGGEFRGSVHTIIHHVLFRNRLPESPFRVQYRREILQLKDGGIVALDWAYPAPMPSGGELVRRPTVLIHHGLCGDSQSSYVRHVAPKLIARGFNVVSLVARGCGGLELKTPDGFTAARTEDMRDAFLHLETLHHVGDLYGVGFSLGAGILLKYLGEEGDMARLKGAVAVSPAFDFSIQPPHFALWSRLNLVHNLKAWACKHEVLRAGIPWDQLMAAKDVRAFDTVAVVAHYGYRDVDEYYSDASAKHVAGKVFVPTLALTADDDPVCSAKGVPGPDDMGPGLVSLATETGGHVAFAQGFLGWDSWQDQVVCDFLQSARDVASAAAT